jgi:LPXTG-motif cell wall-anchored protein
MEVVFLLFFGQWYANRYFHFGGQLPFEQMVAIILGLWALILFGGWWFDRRKRI